MNHYERDTTVDVQTLLDVAHNDIMIVIDRFDDAHITSATATTLIRDILKSLTEDTYKQGFIDGTDAEYTESDEYEIVLDNDLLDTSGLYDDDVIEITPDWDTDPRTEKDPE